MIKRLYITTPLRLERQKWITGQIWRIHKNLTLLRIRDYGIDVDNKPWIEIDESEIDKITEFEYEAYYPAYLYVNYTGGDGKDPIGIKNDGIDKINVEFRLYKENKPKSDLLTDNEEPTTARMTIRNDDGSIYDIILIEFTGSVGSIEYTTTNLPQRCHISEGDLTFIGPYKVVFMDGIDTSFIVYRDLS